MCLSVRVSIRPISNAFFLATAVPILTTVGVWLDTQCGSMNLKIHDNQGAQR